MKWLPSACILVEKSLQQQNYSNNDQREAVLTLGLLRSLLQRLSNVQEWYGVIHRRSLLHVILSHTHHSLRSIVNPEVIPNGVHDLSRASLVPRRPWYMVLGHLS